MSNPRNIAQILPQWMQATNEQDEGREYEMERYELGFRTDNLAPSVKEAYDAVQLWLNDILHGETARARWVTLHGAPGCGKSHLCIGAIGILKNNGKRAQKWSWIKLRDRIFSGEGSELIRWITKMPYLAIDDFLSDDRAKGASVSLLYELMEARLGKWTLLTTNLVPDDIQDARITSRLVRGRNVVVDMQDADDYSLMQYRSRQTLNKH